MAEPTTPSGKVLWEQATPDGEIRDFILAIEQEAREELSRARPVVYVSVSGGIADTETYGDLRVVHIDWDSVDDGDKYAVADVLDLIEDEELPERLRNDIQLSLDRAFRYELDDKPATRAAIEALDE